MQNCFSSKGRREIEVENRMLRVTVGHKGRSKGTAMGILIIRGLHQTTKLKSTM
jgi:hypothetical protein